MKNERRIAQNAIECLIEFGTPLSPDRVRRVQQTVQEMLKRKQRRNESLGPKVKHRYYIKR